MSWLDRFTRSKGEHDSFFLVPDYATKFIQTINPTLPEGYKVVPWTIIRAVALMYGSDDTPLLYITYECLDDCPEMGHNAILDFLKKEKEKNE